MDRPISRYPKDTPDPNLVVAALRGAQADIKRFIPPHWRKDSHEIEVRNALPHAEAIAEEWPLFETLRAEAGADMVELAGRVNADLARREYELRSREPAVQELIAAARDLAAFGPHPAFPEERARLRAALKKLEE
jgi:hypothetical protein